MNEPLPLIDDFYSIATQKRPLIDTRAPIEFKKGSFPNTVNIPLMNNEERELVGTTYKKKGHDAAVKLGHSLVSGETRQKRIETWIDFLRRNPNAYIFCWRGGQRSEIVQRWIYEKSGLEVPRLKGGYKAFRNYLSDKTLQLADEKEIIIIGGRTGSGKTLLLDRLEDAIDLEGIAHHRGSAFGRYAHPQPTQINFENSLAYSMIENDAAGHKRIIMEDESRNIGQCYIPHELFKKFQKGKLIILETPLEKRVDITYNDYILFAQNEYNKAFAAKEAEYNWIDTMRHNFKRIKKRLGNERFIRLTQMLENAWEEQQRTGNAETHKEWIRELLSNYYDPMYDYQIESKKERIIFRGDFQEVAEFLSTHSKKSTNI